MTFFSVGSPLSDRIDLVGPVNPSRTAQQWSEIEVVDLPKCGRCGFRGRRHENVSISENCLRGVYSYCTHLAKYGHVRRSVFAGGDDISEMVRS
jgi:hypothetical protein